MDHNPTSCIIFTYPHTCLVTKSSPRKAICFESSRLRMRVFALPPTSHWACRPLMCLGSRRGGKETPHSNSRFQFSTSEGGEPTETPICEFGRVYFLLIKQAFGACAARVESL